MECLEPKPQLTSFAEDDYLVIPKLVDKMLEETFYSYSPNDYEVIFITQYMPLKAEIKLILKRRFNHEK